MPESFLALSRADRRDALGVAAGIMGRPAHLLEKDVVVVAVLDALFSAPFGNRLVFKGGTSLSKAHHVIGRFSEDVDVTYDIRALLPELANEPADPIPPNRSQADRWTGRVQDTLPAWVQTDVLSAVRGHFLRIGLQGEVQANGDSLECRYESAIDDGLAYVSPAVTVEFGGRATGEPSTSVGIECDVAVHLPSLGFPTAQPRAMTVERTFWEKATAVHAFCCQNRLKAERLARHWWDLVKLDEAGCANRAMRDRALARLVALHKQRFFRDKDADGTVIDYRAAVSGELTLVPKMALKTSLREDYEAMRTAGLLDVDSIRFDDLLTRCGKLESRINAETQILDERR